MNFLSKNMSFLIISVSTLNYPNLELISRLHFTSNRQSRKPLRFTPEGFKKKPAIRASGSPSMSSPRGESSKERSDPSEAPPCCHHESLRKRSHKSQPFAPRVRQACRAKRVFQGAQRPPPVATTNRSENAVTNPSHSRLAVSYPLSSAACFPRSAATPEGQDKTNPLPFSTLSTLAPCSWTKHCHSRPAVISKSSPRGESSKERSDPSETASHHTPCRRSPTREFPKESRRSRPAAKPCRHLFFAPGANKGHPLPSRLAVKRAVAWQHGLPAVATTRRPTQALVFSRRKTSIYICLISKSFDNLF